MIVYSANKHLFVQDVKTGVIATKILDLLRKKGLSGGQEREFESWHNSMKFMRDIVDDKIWAINPRSFEEVGCIHTAQGLEFDYVGVLIGKDLTYDKSSGRVVTDKTAISRDDNSSGIRGASDSDARRLILNTYKTLLTRGQKGCYVYCEDEALRDYFLEKISQ